MAGVLLSGGTGFLGSHVLRKLIADGHEIVLLKRAGSSLARIRQELALVTAYDVDVSPLEAIFERHAPATVLHAATCYETPDSKPSRIFETNLVFGFRLLEAAAACGTRSFLNVGTALTGDVGAYAASKRLFATQGARYASLTGLQFVDVEMQVLLGPDDEEGRFVPRVIRQCLAHEPVALTRGEQRRDFVDVDDAAEAFRLVVARAAAGDALASRYELGNGQAVTIRELVTTIKRLSGSRSRLDFGVVEYRKDEVMHAQADTRALAELGWQPKWSLEESLARVVARHASPRSGATTCALEVQR